MGIDIEEAKNSLFGNLKKNSSSQKTKENPKAKAKATTATVDKKTASIKVSKNKKETLHSVLVRMEAEDKDSLDILANRIMRFRSKRGGERITTNSLIRSLITLLLDNEKKLDIEGIDGEGDLRERISKMLRG